MLALIKEKLSWTLVRHFLEAIIAVEILSFLAYFYPPVGHWAAIIGWLVVLILSWKNLSSGLLVLLVDLLIDSKGYLLFFPIGGFKLSWRIGVWAIVMVVWFVKLLWQAYQQKTLSLDYQRLKTAGLLPLAAMLFFGTVSAIIQHCQSSNIFFDANGWLFWLIILPVMSVAKWPLKRLMAALMAGLLWLVAKTALLLYIFGHSSSAFLSIVYRWVRDTQVGEITKMSAQFYRVFIQSQVYLLIILAIAAWLLARQMPIKNWFKWLWQSGWSYLLILSLSLFPLIIGFSRSFWFGLAVIGLFLLVMVWRYYGWSIVWRWLIASFIALILALIMIVVIVRFPWPKPQLSFDAGTLLEERLGDLGGEAGASSRWALLPKMTEAIKKQPIFGHGFGATITYQSADPRVLAINNGGNYTTYAFEWGWLDIAFKFGLLWAIWYFWWLNRIAIISWRQGVLGQALTIGLLVLLAVHLFSPYLNHPLGIGYLSAMLTWLTVKKYD